MARTSAAIVTARVAGILGDWGEVWCDCFQDKFIRASRDLDSRHRIYNYTLAKPAA
jgi:hypothetical protein